LLTARKSPLTANPGDMFQKHRDMIHRPFTRGNWRLARHPRPNITLSE